MCVLCLKPMFPEIDFGATEKAKRLSKAVKLKAEVRRHEEEVQEALRKGQEPCPNTLARLELMRAEQYELAKAL